MNVIDAICGFQQNAIKIKPPPGTKIEPARGGLTGPAFFPEGLGLTESSLVDGIIPSVMAVGHNFGCAQYREEINAAGREDDKPTWRNLDNLLINAGLQPGKCFRTNWFIGLLPGGVQVGKFLKKTDASYETACNQILIEQIRYFRPMAILLLGPEVARRIYQIMPTLIPWRDTRNWREIDRSEIGYSPKAVEVRGAGVKTNVAALLHPSFGAANQTRRMMNMLQPATEAEIVRTALRA